jgi:hypothetical protein
MQTAKFRLKSRQICGATTYYLFNVSSRSQRPIFQTGINDSTRATGSKTAAAFVTDGQGGDIEWKPNLCDHLIAPLKLLATKKQKCACLFTIQVFNGAKI